MYNRLYKLHHLNVSYVIQLYFLLY